MHSKSMRESDQSNATPTNDPDYDYQTDDKKQKQREINKQQKQLSNKLQKLKREIEEKEEFVSMAELRIAQIEETLANPPSTFTALQIAKEAELHAQAQTELERAISDWESLCVENEDTATALERLRNS